jgi:hypothetical protein
LPIDFNTAIEIGKEFSAVMPSVSAGDFIKNARIADFIEKVNTAPVAI